MKRTGGGLFDSTAGHIYFFAGSPAWHPPHMPEHTLMALNDIIDNSGERQHFMHRMQTGGKVFLDSGVFNLANQHAIAHGMTMDEALGLPPTAVDGFARLRDAYVKVVREHEDALWGYVELDQGGAARKRETRAELEAEGVCPIPVYHPFNDGWDYFDELASEYDRICIGNVVQASTPVRKRLLSTIWERRRAYPHVWLHLLGLTPSELVGSLPFDSCDSSSFVGSMRYGVTATPFAMASLKRLASGDPSFTYNPAADQAHRTGASQMAATGTEHLRRAWLVQMREAAKLAPPLPPVQEWEPELR